jgi:uncharacterized membrane protein YeaQ/YmgE (transglycosylase-associated protein family)
MSILGAIIGGLIVGLLARFILPGRQGLSLPITAAIGIVAALIGWWVAGKLGVQSTSGIDWLRWIISIIIAAVGIVVYGKVTNKA